MASYGAMRIVVAPDSYKESLDAVSAARALARGVRAADPDAEVDLCPVADGGEGTLDALLEALGGERRSSRVTGPLGETVDAEWGILGDGRTVVIESAQAVGLSLVPPGRRDPTRTTSYGLGELIREATALAPERIIVGLGGSAVNDLGVGMAQALGVEFGGLPVPAAGKDLGEVRFIDNGACPDALFDIRFTAACDVTNPLLGPEGAARTYAPQKGASPEQVELLERAAERFVRGILWVDHRKPGMGAAGGLGFGLKLFCAAKLTRGIDVVLRTLRFSRRVRGADLVLTGEGRIDAQSLHGKACYGVLRASMMRGVPVIALAGTRGEGSEALLDAGFAACHAITDRGISEEEARRHAARHLEDLARDAVLAFRE